MSTAHTNQQPSRNTPALFWWLLAALIFAALIPTVWMAVDGQAAALFIGPSAVFPAGQWPWVVWINAYIPALFRTLVVLALLPWLVLTIRRRAPVWRLTLAFIAVAVTVGPGLVVNSGFKENWQRARPYQVQAFGGPQQFTRAGVITDQCDNNCSFVSGHVACGFFVASLMLVDRRRRVAWAAAGVASGLVIGFARMADSAHWLSDVLWAGPITLVCSWLVWQALLRCYPASLFLDRASQQSP